MRIGHSELENCRANPRRWAGSHLGSGGNFKTFGYNQAVKLAIYTFHSSSDALAAKSYLAEKLRRFADSARVDQCKAVLSSYIDWAQREGVIVADCKVRLNLSLDNDLILGGEISRVDIDPTSDTYRAIILGDRPANWRKQLRFPLIQHEIGTKYARPVARVQVGFQELDGTGLSTAQFAKTQIEDALKEAESISEEVQAEVLRSRGRR